MIGGISLTVKGDTVCGADVGVSTSCDEVVDKDDVLLTFASFFLRSSIEE